MKQCKLCKKKGLFLKLNSENVCPDCVRLNEINKKTLEAEKNLNSLNDKIFLLNNDIINRENIIKDLRTNKNKLIAAYKEEIFCEYQDEIGNLQHELHSISATFKEREELIYSSTELISKNEKTIESLKNKISRLKNLYDSLTYSTEHSTELQSEAMKVYEEEIKPTVEIQLHYMDVSELKKKFNENKKDIQLLLEKYADRYTTKTNKTIYKIMVLALEAELQNILVDLRYGKLESGKEQVLNMTRKYLSIASDGNQSIVNTMTSFIGQLEALYIKAVEIEYEYYTKKEKIKEEQRALREQMRQEAAERKLLAEQKAQMEKEEDKYKNEIEAIKSNMRTAADDKRVLLENRVKELESQLADIQNKKEEIINLQNGKAGYVYIISNLGSFGEDVFKVGMTRRLDPQERVDELGSASVPFPFDVHSFIFSDDAVTLEHNLHLALNNKRVNKINLRKEFFKVNIDELEQLVLKYEPSAEFRRTMLAEQFRQSLTAGDLNIIYDIEKDIEEEMEDEDNLPKY